MKILLDTHAILWWFFDDPKLSDTAREYIKTKDNQVLISSASAWEIATKYRLGKLPEAGEVVKRLPELMSISRISTLAITTDHALLAGSFDVNHRDPFDRMLAAQSKVEQIPLITVDPALHMFDIEIIW